MMNDSATTSYGLYYNLNYSKDFIYISKTRNNISSFFNENQDKQPGG